MEVGIGLRNAVPGSNGTVIPEWARRAEAAAFATLGTIDRVLYRATSRSLSLAVAAAVSERIRLFTETLISPRNTALLAK
jgi:alkanesulfonate monooxygenase SsuD/methylene tetrahydromethanopterin reductase-like flavin-dependent oxidoreductase (luciferase family)